jgi:hypothetical protein
MRLRRAGIIEPFEKSVRLKSIFANQIKPIFPVQPSAEKTFRFRRRANQWA